MATEIYIRPVTGYFKKGWSLQRFISKSNDLPQGDAQHVLSTIFVPGGFPELPIRGGWGYSKGDAVIIDRHHPAAKNPFNGVGIEHQFVNFRMWLELITVRADGDRHSQCKYEMLKQHLIPGENGKFYDVLHCNITALPDASFEELKSEWEGPNGIKSPYFDKDAHERKRDALTVRYSREYWFEISSFYGRKNSEDIFMKSLDS